MKMFEDAFKEWVRNKENDMTLGEYQLAKQAFIAAARYVTLLNEKISNEVLDKADSYDRIQSDRLTRL